MAINNPGLSAASGFVNAYQRGMQLNMQKRQLDQQIRASNIDMQYKQAQIDLLNNPQPKRYISGGQMVTVEADGNASSKPIPGWISTKTPPKKPTNAQIVSDDNAKKKMFTEVTGVETASGIFNAAKSKFDSGWEWGPGFEFKEQTDAISQMRTAYFQKYGKEMPKEQLNEVEKDFESKTIGSQDYGIFGGKPENEVYSAKLSPHFGDLGYNTMPKDTLQELAVARDDMEASSSEEEYLAKLDAAAKIVTDSDTQEISNVQEPLINHVALSGRTSPPPSTPYSPAETYRNIIKATDPDEEIGEQLRAKEALDAGEIDQERYTVLINRLMHRIKIKEARRKNANFEYSFKDAPASFRKKRESSKFRNLMERQKGL